MSDLPPTPAIDTLQALHRFLKAKADSPAEEKLHISPRVQKMAGEIRKEIERAKNRMRLEAFQVDAPEAVPFAEKVVRSLAALKEVVAASLGQYGQPAHAFYRKLEGSSEEDLESLLEDWDELTSEESDGAKG